MTTYAPCMRKIQQKPFISEPPTALFEREPLCYGCYQPSPSSIPTNAWEGDKGWWSARRWRRKAWVYLGVYAPDVVAGMAVVDAGYLAKAFCYLYHRPSGQLYQQEQGRLGGFRADFGAEWTEPWVLGNYRLERTDCAWNFAYEGRDFCLQVEASRTSNGIGFLCPSQGRGRPFHYTYKNLLLPTQMTFKAVGQRPRQWTNVQGSVDYSKGFPPRHTTWNWTSIMGQLDNGMPLGINVVDHFNEELENTLWLGDQQRLLGKMTYCYAPPLDQQPWQVAGEGLELTLQPWGARREHLNLGLLKSRFTQAFGSVKGRLWHNEAWQPFQGQGVMEEHEARW